MSVWRLLSLVIWLTTWVMWPGTYNGFWTPKMVMWIAGSFALVTGNWWNPPSQLGMHNRWVGFLLAWIIGLVIWQLFVPHLGIPQLSVGSRSLPIRWNISLFEPTFVCLGSFLLMETLVRHTDVPSRWATVAASWCYVATSIALYGLLQYLRFDQWRLGIVSHGNNISDTAMITTFGNPMLTANFLGLIAPLCLMFKDKRFLWIYALLLLDLFLIRSCSSLLAVTLASLFFFWRARQWRRAILFLGSLGFFAVIVVLHPHGLMTLLNPQGRWLMWQQAWSFCQLAPWTGLGLNASVSAFEHGAIDWVWCHNEPLQILMEIGLGGFVLSLFALGTTVKYLVPHLDNSHVAGWTASAIAFAIISCFSFPLRIAPLLAIGVCIWSALEALTQESADEQVPA